tara:strand:- start:6442 stop:8196 length:1755 start_codon:yes stop_codon:yes gene_type:complete
MALLSKTSIYIAGKEVPSFKKLFLGQKIAEHHTLEIIFRMDMFEKEASGLGEKSKEFLGETIAVQTSSISDKSKMGKLEFKGLVTEVKIVKADNVDLGDEIVLIAKSPTIKADGGAHYDSFNEMRLDGIVNSILNNYKLNTDVNSKYTDMIDYCVQHNESGFDFVRRLASQYGEWMYYNGDKLIFGKPEIEETPLNYRQDLIEYKLCLIPLPRNVNYFSNNYLSDTIEENDTLPKPAGSSFDGFVDSVSQDFYNIQTNSWNNNNNSPSAGSQLKTKVKTQLEGVAINQVKLIGSTSNPGVKLGNLIVVEDEKYRVIEVNHSVNVSGEYENNFEAISGSYDAYPLTDINAFPRSMSQVGVVTENHDPEALGRIRVQFPWQVKQGKMSCWMRVVSMQAGGSGGMYRIPHVGDEVIVDFENGNAEIPYTSGSVYNRNSPPPAGSSHASNHFTVWQVGPCKITINEGDGSITIIDKSSSEIKFDGEGNITINATANIDLVALDGEINLNSPTINIGLESSEPDLTNIHGKKIHIHASQELDLKSDIKLNASGVKTIVEGSGTNEVKGAKVKVAGTAMTEIKGGIVKVN